jgi:hypothetical protein
VSPALIVGLLFLAIFVGGLYVARRVDRWIDRRRSVGYIPRHPSPADSGEETTVIRASLDPATVRAAAGIPGAAAAATSVSCRPVTASPATHAALRDLTRGRRYLPTNAVVASRWRRRRSR